MRKFSLMTLVLCALCFGCSKQSGEPSTIFSDKDLQGQVELSSTINSSAMLMTRSVDYENLEIKDGKIYLPSSIVPDVNNFKVEIKGSYIVPDNVVGGQQPGGETEDVLLSYDKLSDYNDALPYLYAGDYSVTFSYGDATIEGLEHPCYLTTYDFTVHARKLSKENISVQLYNSIVRGVTTSDKFNNYYVSSEFTVSTSSGTKIALDPNVMTMFFVEAGTTLNLNGSAVKTNGQTVKFNGDLGTTDRQKCYTIKVDVGDVEAAGISVSFDDSIEHFDVEEVNDELNPDSE